MFERTGPNGRRWMHWLAALAIIAVAGLLPSDASAWIYDSQCAATKTEDSLDQYAAPNALIMLDRSGSMSWSGGGGMSRWEAAKKAIDEVGKEMVQPGPCSSTDLRTCDKMRLGLGLFWDGRRTYSCQKRYKEEYTTTETVQVPKQIKNYKTLHSTSKSNTFERSGQNTTFTFQNYPKSFTGKVKVKLEAWGDFGAKKEYADVYIDGVSKGTMLQSDQPSDCNQSAHTQTWTVDGSVTDDNKIDVRFDNSIHVATQCNTPNKVKASVSFWKQTRKRYKKYYSTHELEQSKDFANTGGAKTFTFGNFTSYGKTMTVDVELWGDYGAGNEYADVSIDGNAKGKHPGPAQCGGPKTKSWEISGSTVSDGQLNVNVDNNGNVDPSDCSTNKAKVVVKFWEKSQKKIESKEHSHVQTDTFSTSGQEKSFLFKDYRSNNYGQVRTSGSSQSSGVSVTKTESFSVDGEERTIYYNNLPAQPESPVDVRVTLQGDYSASGEYAEVWIDGNYQGKHQGPGTDCTARRAKTFQVPKSLVQDGKLKVRVDNSNSVRVYCNNNEVESRVRYQKNTSETQTSVKELTRIDVTLWGGDYGDSNEYADVYVGGNKVGTHQGPSGCNGGKSTQTFYVSGKKIRNQQLEVALDNTAAVGTCGTPKAKVEASYWEKTKVREANYVYTWQKKRYKKKYKDYSETHSVTQSESFDRDGGSKTLAFDQWRSNNYGTQSQSTGSKTRGQEYTRSSSIAVADGKMAKIFLESSTCDSPGYCGSEMRLNGNAYPEKRGINLIVLDGDLEPVYYGGFDTHGGRQWEETTNFAADDTPTNIQQNGCRGCVTDKLNDAIDTYKDKPNHHLMFIGDDQPMPENFERGSTVSNTERKLYNRLTNFGADLGSGDRLRYRDSWLFVAQNDARGRTSAVLEKHARRGNVSNTAKVSAHATVASPGGWKEISKSTYANVGSVDNTIDFDSLADAGSNVDVEVTLTGDYGESSEYANIYVEGNRVGQHQGASDNCQSSTQTFQVAQKHVNDDGTLPVRIEHSAGVGEICDTNKATVDLSYYGEDIPKTRTTENEKVRVDVELWGDYGAGTEYADVYVDGNKVGTHPGPAGCGNSKTATFHVAGDKLQDGSVDVEIDNSGSVETSCTENKASVDLSLWEKVDQKYAQTGSKWSQYEYQKRYKADAGREHARTKSEQFREPGQKATFVFDHFKSNSFGDTSTQDLKTGLVGQWTFNGDYQDQTSHNHHGTARGDTSFSGEAREGGESVQFDGNGDRVEMTSPDPVHQTDRITVAAWVKSSDSGMIVGKPNSYFLWFDSGHLRWEVRDGTWYGGHDEDNKHLTGFDDGKWHHVAGTYDGTHLRTYVDGQLKRSYKKPGLQIEDNNSNLAVGDAPGWNRYLKGNVDGVRIYKRALDPKEVAGLYQGQFGGEYTESIRKLITSSGENVQLKFDTVPDAGSQIEVDVTLTGDYGNNTEYADVYVDGNKVGQTQGPTECGTKTLTYSVPASRASDGHIDVRVDNSSTVSPVCPTNAVKAHVEYYKPDTTGGTIDKAEKIQVRTELWGDYSSSNEYATVTVDGNAQGRHQGPGTCGGPSAHTDIVDGSLIQDGRLKVVVDNSSDVRPSCHRRGGKDKVEVTASLWTRKKKRFKDYYTVEKTKRRQKKYKNYTKTHSLSQSEQFDSKGQTFLSNDFEGGGTSNWHNDENTLEKRGDGSSGNPSVIAPNCSDYQYTDWIERRNLNINPSDGDVYYEARIIPFDSWDDERVRMQIRDDSGWHTVDSARAQWSGKYDDRFQNDCPTADWNSDSAITFRGNFSVTGSIDRVRFREYATSEDSDESLGIDRLLIKDENKGSEETFEFDRIASNNFGQPTSSRGSKKEGASVTRTAKRSFEVNRYPKSCADIDGKAGTYRIDPDGPGGRDSFEVYCESKPGDTGSDITRLYTTRDGAKNGDKGWAFGENGARWESNGESNFGLGQGAVDNKLGEFNRSEARNNPKTWAIGDAFMSSYKGKTTMWDYYDANGNPIHPDQIEALADVAKGTYYEGGWYVNDIDRPITETFAAKHPNNHDCSYGGCMTIYPSYGPDPDGGSDYVLGSKERSGYDTVVDVDWHPIHDSGIPTHMGFRDGNGRIANWTEGDFSANGGHTLEFENPYFWVEAEKSATGSGVKASFDEVQQPASDAELDVTLTGDYGSTTEYADVYVDGKKVGRHQGPAQDCGTKTKTFTVDTSKFGDNEINVRLDNSAGGIATSKAKTSPSTTCPTSGDAVISSDCTYGPGQYNLQSLTVRSGATVHVDNKPSVCDQSQRGSGCANVEYSKYAPVLTVQGKVDIEGRIDASEEGFTNSRSDNRGPGAGQSNHISGGGGYGGHGGDSDSYNDGGPTYGKKSNATRLGSSGGYDYNGIEAGYGGGSIRIETANAFRLDGEIEANGGYGGAGAGGGSGGSIRLRARQFTGSGRLEAEGGGNSNRGGGGGGGRIALYRQTGSANPYATDVDGGDHGNTGNDGASGTVYTSQKSNQVAYKGANGVGTHCSKNQAKFDLKYETADSKRSKLAKSEKVRSTVTLKGDYDAGNEYAKVWIDGNYVGQHPGGNGCNDSASKTFTVSGTTVRDGKAKVRIQNSSAVGSCGSGSDRAQATLEFWEKTDETFPKQYTVSKKADYKKRYKKTETIHSDEKVEHFDTNGDAKTFGFNQFANNSFGSESTSKSGSKSGKTITDSLTKPFSTSGENLYLRFQDPNTKTDGKIEVDVTLRGDYGESSEYAEVWIDGDYQGKHQGPSDCGSSTKTFQVAGSKISDGKLKVRVDNSSEVNPVCTTDEVEAAIEYETPDLEDTTQKTVAEKIRVRVKLWGDYDASNEYATIRLDGNKIGSHTGPGHCGGPASQTFLADGDAIRDGEVKVQVDNSGKVSSGCNLNKAEVRMSLWQRTKKRYKQTYTVEKTKRYRESYKDYETTHSDQRFERFSTTGENLQIRFDQYSSNNFGRSSSSTSTKSGSTVSRSQTRYFDDKGDTQSATFYNMQTSSSTVDVRVTLHGDYGDSNEKATIYVDGNEVGTHQGPSDCGSSTKTFQVPKGYLSDNQLKVKVDNNSKVGKHCTDNYATIETRYQVPDATEKDVRAEKIRLKVRLKGDYKSGNEYANVYVDGNYVGKHDGPSNDCNSGETQTFTVDGDHIRDGQLDVRIDNSGEVDLCGNNDDWARVTAEFMEKITKETANEYKTSRRVKYREQYKEKYTPNNRTSGSGSLRYTWFDWERRYNRYDHPNSESELDKVFDSSSWGVSKGGSGIHDRRIHWETDAWDAKPGYLPAGGYGWRAKGYVFAPKSGTYRIGIDGDDAMDVHIKGQKVADWYGGHGNDFDYDHNGTITLSRGWHPFMARFEEGGGGDGMSVAWEKPGGNNWNVIPAKRYSTYIPKGYKEDTFDEKGDTKTLVFDQYVKNNFGQTSTSSGGTKQGIQETVTATKRVDTNGENLYLRFRDLVDQAQGKVEVDVELQGDYGAGDEYAKIWIDGNYQGKHQGPGDCGSDTKTFKVSSSVLSDDEIDVRVDNSSSVSTRCSRNRAKGTVRYRRPDVQGSKTRTVEKIKAEVELQGDYNAGNEYAKVWIDGNYQGKHQGPSQHCGAFDAKSFNADGSLIQDGRVDIKVSNTNAVGVKECSQQQWHDGFDDGRASDDGWNVYNEWYDDYYEYSGSRSAEIWDHYAHGVQADIHPSGMSGGVEATMFRYYYNEDSGSNGAGVRLRDSDNDEILKIGTNNPQWNVWGGNGHVHVGDGDYRDWQRVTVKFDWENNRFWYEFKDMQDGGTASGWEPFADTDAQDLEEIEIVNIGGDNIEQRFDEFTAKWIGDDKPKVRATLSFWEKTRERYRDKYTDTIQRNYEKRSKNSYRTSSVSKTEEWTSRGENVRMRFDQFYNNSSLDQVRVKVGLWGDFDGSSEYADVYVDGNDEGRHQGPSNQCGGPDWKTFKVPANRLSDGALDVRVDNSGNVHDPCGNDDRVEVKLEFYQKKQEKYWAWVAPEKGKWHDGFDDGHADDDGWNVYNEWYDDHYGYSGSHSAEIDDYNAHGVQAEIHPSEMQGGVSATKFRYYYREDNYSNGAGVRLRDSDNDTIVKIGTNNPQWDVWSGNGKDRVGRGDYHDWQRVTIKFDWQSNRFWYEFKDMQDGGTASGWKPFVDNNAQDLEEIEVINVGGDNIEQRFDEFTVEWDSKKHEYTRTHDFTSTGENATISFRHFYPKSFDGNRIRVKVGLEGDYNAGSEEAEIYVDGNRQGTHDPNSCGGRDWKTYEVPGSWVDDDRLDVRIDNTSQVQPSSCGDTRAVVNLEFWQRTENRYKDYTWKTSETQSDSVDTSGENMYFTFEKYQNNTWNVARVDVSLDGDYSHGEDARIWIDGNGKGRFDGGDVHNHRHTKTYWVDKSTMNDGELRVRVDNDHSVGAGDVDVELSFYNQTRNKFHSESKGQDITTSGQNFNFDFGSYSKVDADIAKVDVSVRGDYHNGEDADIYIDGDDKGTHNGGDQSCTNSYATRTYWADKNDLSDRKLNVRVDNENSVGSFCGDGRVKVNVSFYKGNPRGGVLAFEDFEGSDPGWYRYYEDESHRTDWGGEWPNTDDDSNKEYEGNESGHAWESRGVCGYGGLAKDYSFSSQPKTIEMKLNTSVDYWGRTNVILKDSSGHHVLWTYKGRGFGWKTKQFDISSYDRNFTIIIGNADISSDWCGMFDHGWDIWVDNLKIKGSGGGGGNYRVVDTDTSGLHGDGDFDRHYLYHDFGGSPPSRVPIRIGLKGDYGHGEDAHIEIDGHDVGTHNGGDTHCSNSYDWETFYVPGYEVRDGRVEVEIDNEHSVGEWVCDHEHNSNSMRSELMAPNRRKGYAYKLQRNSTNARHWAWKTTWNWTKSAISKKQRVRRTRQVLKPDDAKKWRWAYNWANKSVNVDRWKWKTRYRWNQVQGPKKWRWANRQSKKTVTAYKWRKNRSTSWKDESLKRWDWAYRWATKKVDVRKWRWKTRQTWSKRKLDQWSWETKPATKTVQHYKWKWGNSTTWDKEKLRRWKWAYKWVEEKVDVRKWRWKTRRTWVQNDLPAWRWAYKTKTGKEQHQTWSWSSSTSWNKETRSRWKWAYKWEKKRKRVRRKKWNTSVSWNKEQVPAWTWGTKWTKKQNSMWNWSYKTVLEKDSIQGWDWATKMVTKTKTVTKHRWKTRQGTCQQYGRHAIVTNDVQEDSHGPVMSTLQRNSPSGGTPTGKAAQALLNASSLQTQKRPSVGILVTDGKPTSGETEAVRHLCGLSGRATSPADTYVVGFSQGSNTDYNNILAAAGDTGHCCPAGQPNCGAQQRIDPCKLTPSELDTYIDRALDDDSGQLACSGSYQANHPATLKSTLLNIAQDISCTVELDFSKHDTRTYNPEKAYKDPESVKVRMYHRQFGWLDIPHVSQNGMVRELKNNNVSAVTAQQYSGEGWRFQDPSKRKRVVFSSKLCGEVLSGNTDKIETQLACDCPNVGKGCQVKPGICGEGTYTCDIPPGQDSCQLRYDQGDRPGKSCTIPGGEGVCAKGSVQCGAAGTTKCIPKHKPGTLLPNEPCTVPGEKGRCAQGVVKCVEGGKIKCVQQHRKMPEICNGLDDNCDGEVDNINESWSSGNWSSIKAKSTTARAATCSKRSSCTCEQTSDRAEKHSGRAENNSGPGSKNRREFNDMVEKTWGDEGNSKTQTQCYCQE